MKRLKIFKMNSIIKFKKSRKTKLLQSNKEATLLQPSTIRANLRLYRLFLEIWNLIKKVCWISFLVKTLYFPKPQNQYWSSNFNKHWLLWNKDILILKKVSISQTHKQFNKPFKKLTLKIQTSWNLF